MTLFRSARRAITGAILFGALATAQQCYFPDGQTPSDDVPCPSSGDAAACCPSSSICLDNGLCFAEGIVSRSSCTDQTWDSPACAGYCKTVSTSSAVAVTPCSSGSDSNIFACGLNTTDCQASTNTFAMSGGSGLSLRASQVAVLLSAALSATPSATAAGSGATVTATVTATAAASSESMYTGGEMAGVGAGLGIPLALSLITLAIFWKRDRRNRPAKLMYKLPDDMKDEFTYRPPTRPSTGGVPSPRHPSTVFTQQSRRESYRTTASGKAGPQGFLERYETMKKTGQVYQKERHELDSAIAKPPPRHELGDGRVSR